MPVEAMSTERSKLEPQRNGRTRAIVASIEAMVLLMVIFSPWAFASVHPAALLILYCLLSFSLILWSLAILIEGRAPIPRCPFLLCISGMVALGIFQIVSLDSSTLASISPATVSVRSPLYPSELESLVGESETFAPASTISFDPSASRARILQLIALIALYSVVRYAAAQPGALYRLAIVCTINGALLSLFAIAQRFSSPPDTIYWSFPTLGSAYGPFVCKNHFPDYANVCLGLGLGLLLGRSFSRRSGTLTERLIDLASDSKVLWLVLAVGLTATAIPFSLSRGGTIASAAAAMICGALAVRTIRLPTAIASLAFAVVIAVAFTSWFGADEIGDRLGTLSQADANRGRREIWSRAMPLAIQFPVFGTGFGTFLTVEPQMRKPGDEQVLNWEHAHNDYLEAAVEGGAVGLSLVLLAAIFAFRSGLRAFLRLRNRSEGALALGGLFGLSAIAVHSFGDFGMHIPAVALLIVVLVAHLNALDSASDPVAVRSQSRLAVLPTIAACAIVAFILPIDGWFRERAEHFRLAAVRAGNRLPAGERDDVVRYLRAASEFAPDDSAIRVRLADAEYREYLARTSADTNASGPEQAYLRSALRDYLRLRAANPFYDQSHARLAGNRQHLQRPDSVERYLERATRLRPTDGELWYLAGLDRTAAGDWDRAWHFWHLSMVCSQERLKDVLPMALARLGAEKTVDTILTSSPQLLLEATRLPPLKSRRNDRVAFAARASERIEALSFSNKDDLYARARLLREAERLPDAIAAYDTLVARFPDATDWRMELAEVLLESGRVRDAEAHIVRVLAENPSSAAARDLNAEIVRVSNGSR